MRLNTLIALIILSIHCNLYAFLERPETTRVMGTAGAGVGSILLNESTFLNPASIVFLTKSGMYYQRDSVQISQKSENRTGKYDRGLNELGLIVDNSSRIKGAFSYARQHQNFGKRIRYASSLGFYAGKRGALGFNVSYQEENSDLVGKKEYFQMDVGYTYIANDSLVLGFVGHDISSEVYEYKNHIVGLQYSTGQFALIADYGARDINKLEETKYYAVAGQLQSFKYLFLRVGMFHDELIDTKGVGYGISWIGPKISFEYAIKNSEIIENSDDNVLAGEKYAKHSLAFTLLF